MPWNWAVKRYQLHVESTNCTNCFDTDNNLGYGAALPSQQMCRFYCIDAKCIMHIQTVILH